MKLKFKKFVPIILLIGTTLSLIGSMTPTSAAGIHHPENAPNCIGVCSGTELEAYPNLLKTLEVPTSENPGDWLWYKLPDGPVWSDGQSWGNPEYYSTIQAGDINGDGRAVRMAFWLMNSIRTPMPGCSCQMGRPGVMPRGGISPSITARSRWVILMGMGGLNY